MLLGSLVKIIESPELMDVFDQKTDNLNEYFTNLIFGGDPISTAKRLSSEWKAEQKRKKNNK